jgi:hypothetical protein
MKRTGPSDEAGPARKKDFLMHHPAPPFGVAGTILYLVAASAATGQHPAASACSAQHGLGQSGGQGCPQQSFAGSSAQHGSVRPAGHVSGLNAAMTWLEDDASVFSAKLVPQAAP